jgi:type VI secretion system secreted protein Hcp
MRKSRLTMFATLASIAAAFAVAPTANAATDYLLEIDGVPGESTAVKNAIDVNAFSWGAENTTTIGSATGGAGTGKASFNKLQIDKNVDVATTALFQKLTTGQHIPSVELVARKAGSPAPYLRYCLRTVFVTSQEQAGSAGDDAPQESVEFTFGSMQQSYARQTATGALMSPVFSGWDVMSNLTISSAYQSSCGGSGI